MIVSEREKGLLVVTVLVLLYGALFMVYGKQRDKINAAIGQRRQRETQLAMERDLISQRAIWDEAYGDNSSLMPVFESARQVETHRLNLVERLAKDSGLTIIRRQVGEERQEGDVFEIPIECREWEGSLESVVKFLYAVHSEGAMLDVRKLTVHDLRMLQDEPERIPFLRDIRLAVFGCHADLGVKAVASCQCDC